jgi:hypothetical protein
VPDQTKSLPGLLSASSELTGWDRNIGAIPAYVTGPAARTCGGCHRAAMINADNVSELQSFFQHTEMGGYLVEAGETPLDTLTTTFEEIRSYFE